MQQMQGIQNKPPVSAQGQMQAQHSTMQDLHSYNNMDKQPLQGQYSEPGSAQPPSSHI
jgi:hypothetical protein